MFTQLWLELRKPFNAVMAGITFISLVVAVLALVPRERSRIAYDVSQIPILAKAGVTPAQGQTSLSGGFPFTVLDRDGARIDQEIYAATITVWNSGNSELGNARVRRPLTITMPGASRIIDVAPQTLSHDNISGFKFAYTYSKDPASPIVVTWIYFDPGEGFRLRVIYTSDSRRDVALSGSIFGVDRFLAANEPLFAAAPAVFWTMAGVLFGFSILFAIIAWRRDKFLSFRKSTPAPQRDVTAIILMGISCSFLGMVAGLFSTSFFRIGISPPF